jgi:hypothetical protein
MVILVLPLPFDGKKSQSSAVVVVVVLTGINTTQQQERFSEMAMTIPKPIRMVMKHPQENERETLKG